MNDVERKEQEKRVQYLRSLRDSADFQKYVVRGIIDKEIDRRSNLKNLPLGTGDFEKIGKLCVAEQLTVMSLEGIKNMILNHPEEKEAPTLKNYS